MNFSVYGGKKKRKQEKAGQVVDRIEIKPILHTNQKVGFCGFIMDMIALMLMYKEHVEITPVWKSIPTYNFLQDFLEMFFARIRACSGSNNNPTVQQFKGSWFLAY